jgi:hypothetical protein
MKLSFTTFCQFYRRTNVRVIYPDRQKPFSFTTSEPGKEEYGLFSAAIALGTDHFPAVVRISDTFPLAHFLTRTTQLWLIASYLICASLTLADTRTGRASQKQFIIITIFRINIDPHVKTIGMDFVKIHADVEGISREVSYRFIILSSIRMHRKNYNAYHDYLKDSFFHRTKPPSQ